MWNVLRVPLFALCLPSNLDVAIQGFKYIGNTALDLTTRGFEVRMSTDIRQPHAPTNHPLRSLLAMKKPLGSCSGRKLETKMALQQQLANRVTMSLPTLLHRSQLVFAEMVASLHQSGQTVRGFLSELYQTYGYFQVNPIVATAASNPECFSDEQWLLRLLRPSGCAANFFPATRLQRNSKLIYFVFCGRCTDVIGARRPRGTQATLLI